MLTLTNLCQTTAGVILYWLNGPFNLYDNKAVRDLAKKVPRQRLATHASIVPQPTPWVAVG